MMRYVYAVALLLCFYFRLSANPADTIHVSHYNITIDTINYSTHSIRGVTELTVHSKINGLNNITLGLYYLQIDSVSASGVPLNYTYDNTYIHITPAAVLNQNDSMVLRIRYHGTPATDATFGGFYFSGQYAYNIGVGFDVDPHTFGKAWFPCLDEFDDKSTYEFHIVTPSNYKAFCNGLLQSSTSNGNGTVTWHWQLNQPIPPYLASMAVAPFYTIKRTYQGIPVELAVLPGDSAKTIATYQHLNSALANDIAAYGPYPWDKVGFIMVPFNSGAMEHATSIHVGKYWIDGTINYETLWAHELSHMWWGDLVTCANEQEMWINEGWATFNENFFTEAIYGQAAYESARRLLHRQILQYTHRQDYGFYALNDIPHAYTYGYTVYQKGSDIVHSLRRFMGDSLFFKGVKDFLWNRAYGNATSEDLRDELANSSGINLTDYFSTLVMMKGAPHVSVDSFTVVGGLGGFTVTVYTREKMEGNSSTFSLPVEFTFDDGVSQATVSATVNAATNIFTYNVPFHPLWVAVDRDDKLTDAVVDYEINVASTGNFSFPETYCSMQVMNTGGDTSTVRMINHYVPPDWTPNLPPGVRISDFHYFSVEGIFAPGFLAKGSFGYDGNTNYTTGYLDNTLFTGNLREDSLVILYRPNSGQNWQLVNGYTINFGASHLDKKGSMVVDTLKVGEYVIGIRTGLVAIEATTADKEKTLTISPNPSNSNCRISFKLPAGETGEIKVFDNLGRMVFSSIVYSHQEAIDWDTYKVQSGIYTVALISAGKRLATAKAVVK